jgi:hypothetical protein
VLVSSALGALLGGYFSVYLTDWLFPTFELFAEKPRRRRFGWWVLTLLLLPTAIGILLLVIEANLYG